MCDCISILYQLLNNIALNKLFQTAKFTVPAVTKNNYKVAQAATETADGSRTQFTVPENFVAGTLMVFNQGILMRVGADNDFTLSGRVVTFEEAPANGANVLFSYILDES